MDVKGYDTFTDEQIIADIAAQIGHSKTPDHMRANLEQFQTANRERHSECFTIALWAVARMLGDRSGTDAEMALRLSSIALIRAATLASVACNDALGKPVEPGRVALVAWTVAAAELDRLAAFGIPAGATERLLRDMSNPDSEVFADEAAPAEIAATKEA